MTAGLVIHDLSFLENGPYSLSIAPGECVGLTGLSGIGKTQFLRAIVDIIPHNGELLLDGHECETMLPCEWRKQVSMLPAESRWWYDHVGEHFPHAYLTGSHVKWLHPLGFSDDVMNWRVSRLSTGEKQRLSFMRAMIHQPRVLLLDEPTSSLDYHHTAQLEKILFDLRQHHQIGLIWVSHDLEQLQRTCSHSYRLEKQGLQTLE